MECSKTLVVATFLATLALPSPSSAQSQPLPGKWERGINLFAFDDKTKAYVPFALQSGDNDIVTECLSETFFREKSFHVPKFHASEQERQGRRCVVSNERQSAVTTTWRQVCTDPNSATKDERLVISISSDELSLEHTIVDTLRNASGHDLERRMKMVAKFKRIGECDNMKGNR